jgi:hypothetical protein
LHTQYITSKGGSIALYGQAAALDLLRSKSDASSDCPIFVLSRGRAGIAHLNLDVPHGFAGFDHVVVVVVNEEEVSDARTSIV